MSTTTSDYMLFFRGNDWFEGLKAEGTCIGGYPPEDEGKIVSGPKGRGVADGPFAAEMRECERKSFMNWATEQELIAR